MEQKFIKFDEALELLGISADRLNGLREEGQVRAYRDGSSWKFRGDEIQRMVEEGVPEPAPPSDIGFTDSGIDLADDEGSLELELSGSDANLASGAEAPSEPSDLEFRDSDLDDTIPAETSDLALDKPDEPSDPSDSILLSEEELGESSSAPASTIIGRGDLELEDADLELASEDSKDKDDSDVKLASAGASSILSPEPADSDDVLDALEDEPSHASAFENLEELEIDLAAESSRILSPEDVENVKAAAEAEAGAPKGDSDLTLDDVGVVDEGSDAEPTELSSLELDMGSEGGGESSDVEIDLASESDDFVLDESVGGGSDLSLDSGINLVDPSDSGIGLEDIPLEMGGSAILESLSLGGEDSDPELSLIGGESSAGISGEESAAELQTDDDFQLTPMGESEADADDSSSQVIALDEGLGGSLAGLSEVGEDAPSSLLSEADLVEEAEPAAGSVVLTDDEALGVSEDFDAYAGTGAAPVAAVPAAGDYTLWNILTLGSCALLLIFGCMMMLDMVRNIWSWGETYELNSSILDSLLGWFGLN